MNRQEAVALTRYVKACCPRQAIDEYTPDAWHDLLGDLDLDACRQAVTRVARRQPFVAPAEIRAEVRTERERRLAAVSSDKLLPAGDVADDAGAYLQQVRERVKVVADGKGRMEVPMVGVPLPPELPQGRLRPREGGTICSAPDDVC